MCLALGHVRWTGGNNRVPNVSKNCVLTRERAALIYLYLQDVDLLVLPPPEITVSVEDLKKNLVALDPYHFFTSLDDDSQTTYHTLRYPLTNSSVHSSMSACKIDFLLPAEMNLPNLPPSRIHWDKGLPLVPLSLLLLQKRQAWDNLNGLTSLSALGTHNRGQIRHCSPQSSSGEGDFFVRRFRILVVGLLR